MKYLLLCGAFIAVFMGFMLTYVSFIMFGGEVRTQRLSERFSLMPYDATIQRDVGYDVRLQPAENVQFTVSSDYFRGGSDGARSVPFSTTQHYNVKLEVK